MKKTSFIFLLFSAYVLFGQNHRNSIGGGIGAGSFLGDFPSQTVFGTKLFYETLSPVSIFSKIQFHTSYGQKIEKILPGSFDYEHYSYFLNFGFSGIFEQPLNKSVTIREGVGIIYLNDRSFDDIDTWNIGTLINLGFHTNLNQDLSLNLNIDYGITFNNTNSSYFLLLFGIAYNF